MVFIKQGTMFPEPDDFGKRFHDLFKQPSENQRFVIDYTMLNYFLTNTVNNIIIRKRIEWKKLKKKNVKNKDKRKNKLELINDNGLLSPPEIELPGNASAFAVFASVRLAVLERWMRHATQEYLQSSCSAPLHDISEIDSDTEENSQNSTYLPMRVSKVSNQLLHIK